jgi:hypothetical protein
MRRKLEQKHGRERFDRQSERQARNSAGLNQVLRDPPRGYPATDRKTAQAMAPAFLYRINAVPQARQAP